MNLKKITKHLELIGFKADIKDDCLVMIMQTPGGKDIAYNVFFESNQLTIICKTFRRFGVNKDPQKLNGILCQLNEKYAYYKFLVSDTSEIMMHYSVPDNFISNPDFVLVMMFAAADIVDKMAEENIGRYSGC